MPDHSEREILRELFPATARQLYGAGPQRTRETLGLYPVADGKLALVYGAQLAEFTPIPPKGQGALHCELCHYTRSRSEAAFYRVQVTPTLSRYLPLCLDTEQCVRRAGPGGLKTFAERVFPVETPYAD